jgi:ABC-type polysaccharide/polyol phosphate transport system ATPase subunit
MTNANTNDCIVLDHVKVDYPIYNANAKVLRNQLARTVNLRGSNRFGDDFRIVNALKDVSFKLKVGASVGVIGLNGAGKSTLLKLMAGVLEPNRGHVNRTGKINAILNIASGFEPELTGYQNIRRVGLLRGFSKTEIEALTPEIIEFSGLGDFILLPVRTYSAGMRVRLSFSIATAGAPDVVLIDEVFNAGDAEFRERASARITGLMARSQAFVFSSHSLGLIREFCNQCLYLERGRVKACGDLDDVIDLYLADTKAAS